MPLTLLVVDDEAAARYALRQVFQSTYRVVEAAGVGEARERLQSDAPAVVLLDYYMPGETGLELLRDFAATPGAPAFIMLTAHGCEKLAVDAMKAGAYDYLAKPYDIDELRLVTARAAERQKLRGELDDLREKLAAGGQFGRMIGVSRAMRDVFENVAAIAGSELPVLILGESGTGKDLLAREIHLHSARREGPFVALNSAALPDNLVESELFGYEKGAFTGATGAHAGKFEQAHQGTLFLDEIGDMPGATQAKILRAVEAGCVERLGGRRATPVDVRVISATNREIDAAIRGGVFRQDLYYRLAGVTLGLPPLRTRREDIPLLAERFWGELRARYGRPGPELTREAVERLEQAPWPGNARELRTVLEKLFVMVRGECVTAGDAAHAVGPPTAAPAGSPAAALDAPDYREARRLFEIEYLSRKLRENGGNVTRTAAAIGIERQTLQEKIRQLGIERD